MWYHLFMSRRRYFIAFLFIVCFFVGVSTARFAFADDQTSANFVNNDSTFSPATFDASSPNFSLNSSLGSIVGVAESANFVMMQGVPLREPVPVVPPTPPTPPTPSGPGGIPVTYPDQTFPPVVPGPTTTVPQPSSLPRIEQNPTLQYQAYTFKSDQIISGTRRATDSVVWVNGSSEGVTYPDATHWKRELPLFIGPNLITVSSVGPDGTRSETIVGTIERLMVGDANRDHIVDDVDISLWTRGVKKYSVFADFNEDGKVNDLDLSLIASHWLMHYPL